MGNVAQPLGNQEPQGTALPPVTPLQAPVTQITRRDLLQRIAEWASKGALVKQVGSAVVGIASGGAGVYHYLEPQLRSITGKDFFVGDTTEVWLSQDGRYVLVKISRTFDQTATKTGYYNYKVECEGEWAGDECSMKLLKFSGGAETIDLATEADNESGDLLSVVQPRDGKPIFVRKGDVLKVKLVSTEKIDRVKGGYRLRLVAQFNQASFTLHTLPGGPSSQEVQCFAYAEKQGQVLLPVSLDKALPLDKCTSGIEYLISWVGRSIST